VEFPAGALDAGRAATAAAHRLLLTFRAAQDGVPPPSPMLDFSAPLTAPPALVPRLLPVYAVRDLAAAAAFVEGHRLPVQALGIVDPADPDVRAFAETIGAVRIARLGTMQAPPLAGRHGGRPRITDFVRWLDAE
jgi:hypothetical protein